MKRRRSGTSKRPAFPCQSCGLLCFAYQILLCLIKALILPCSAPSRAYDGRRSVPGARKVLKLRIQEALIKMFTDDPVKWSVVFAILIGGYVASPCRPTKSRPRPRLGAEAGPSQRTETLSPKHLFSEVFRYGWRAIYRCTVEDEEW